MKLKHIFIFVIVITLSNSLQSQILWNLNKYFFKKLYHDKTFYCLSYASNKNWVSATSSDLSRDRYPSRSFPFFSIESYTRVNIPNEKANYFFLNFAVASWLNNLHKEPFNEYSVKAKKTNRNASFQELFAIGGSTEIFKPDSYRTLDPPMLGIQYRLEHSGLAFESELKNGAYPLLGASNNGSGSYIKGYRHWFGLNSGKVFNEMANILLYLEYTPSNSGGIRINPELSFTKEPLYFKIGYRYSRFFGVSEDRRSSNIKFSEYIDPIQAINVNQFYFKLGFAYRHDRVTECQRGGNF